MRIVTRLAAALMFCGLYMGTDAALAAFPERPIHLIVSMPPGGGADSVARIVATKFGEKIGQAVVVENRAGADGSLAADFVSRQPADGYTLVWITNSHTVSPITLTVNYDPVKSFTPISLISQAPDVLVVPKALPVATLQDLVALAKAKPNELNFGSAGTSTPSFLEATQLMAKTGIKMVHVPYKGGSEVIVGLLGGSVQMYFATISTALPQIQSGALKGLALVSDARSPLLPDEPTVAEALKLPSFEGGNWLGVLAPANLPPDIADTLNRAFVDAVSDADVKARLKTLGWTTVGSSRGDFTHVIASDLARWSALLKDSTAK